MLEFGKRIDGPGGRRRSLREAVLLAVGALTLEGSYSVVVEDVCPTGAKLKGARLARKGEELLLKAGPFQALSEVVWVEGDECGISFEPALNYECVQILKEEAQWATVMGIC